MRNSPTPPSLSFPASLAERRSRLAIARGLARYGSLGPRVSAFREEVGAFARTELPDLVGQTVPDLRKRLARTLADAITWQGIKPALLNVNQGRISSLEGLEERIRRNLEEWAARDEARATRGRSSPRATARACWTGSARSGTGCRACSATAAGPCWWPTRRTSRRW